MKTVEEFLRHADECRVFASHARSPDERTMILNMAATWEELARSREAMIKAAEAIDAVRGNISAKPELTE
jgi:hypothetical protein